MLHVTPLREDKREIFIALFKDYYAELGCGDDAVHLAEEYVIPDMLAGLLCVDMIEDGDSAVGFVIYQTDDIDNEWNFKEGWGDVREIYISPSHRGQGLGKFLLYTAEMKLNERGTAKCYCLPPVSAVPFFLSCGYIETEEYDDELDCTVFVKTDLNNCECKNK